jgi:hypothetical protein
MKGDSLTLVNAYAVVSANDDEENGTSFGNRRDNVITTLPSSNDGADTAEAVVSMPHQKNHSSLRDVYRTLPEASSLQWNDDFFSQEDDIIAVFDLDCAAVWVFYTFKLGTVILLTFLYFAIVFSFALAPTIVFYMFMACCLLIFLNALQMSRYAKAQHVAITSDGVRFVVDQHHTLCGWSWTDCGKTTKTVRSCVVVFVRILFCLLLLTRYFFFSFHDLAMQIPFDQITDCVIHEGQILGNRIRIQTTAATSALLLAGVKDPLSLQKLLFAMKRCTSMHASSIFPYQHPQS